MQRKFPLKWAMGEAAPRDQAVDPWSAVGGTAKGQELVDAVDLVSKVDKNANVVDRGSARPQGQPAPGCAARGVVGR